MERKNLFHTDARRNAADRDACIGRRMPAMHADHETFKNLRALLIAFLHFLMDSDGKSGTDIRTFQRERLRL